MTEEKQEQPFDAALAVEPPPLELPDEEPDADIAPNIWPGPEGK